jgi:hypothetical protein
MPSIQEQEMLKWNVVAVTAIALGLLGESSVSEANYIPFSGSGTSGTIATPPGSITWSYPGASGGTFAWGTPGLGAGELNWPASASVSELTVSFTGLPGGVSILGPVDTTSGGFLLTTRLSDDSKGVAWPGTISGAGNSVTFFAPSGQPLSPNDSFFVNVVFTASAGSSVNFTGAFDPQLGPTVPEPSSIILLGTSTLAGIGYFLGRRRRAEGLSSI